MKIVYSDTVQDIYFPEPYTNCTTVLEISGGYNWKLKIDGADYGAVKYDYTYPIMLSQGKHTFRLSRFSNINEFEISNTDNKVIKIHLGMLKKAITVSSFNRLKTDPNQIIDVKIIGTRTAVETDLGVFVDTHYNYTIYSFLVTRSSGKKEVIECRNGSKEFDELIQYVDSKQST